MMPNELLDQASFRQHSLVLDGSKLGRMANEISSAASEAKLR